MRVLLIVVLSLLAVAARAAGNEPIEKNIEWTLSLAADGKIESMKPIDRDLMRVFSWTSELPSTLFSDRIRRPSMLSV